MKARYNELYIGISVTVATLIVVVGILYLERSAIFAPGMVVEVLVKDANGIGQGAKVVYRGVDVGSVRGVSFVEEGILIRTRLEGAPPIPEDSEFVVVTTDLLEGKAIEVRPGTSDSMLESGARVRGRTVTGVMEMTDELTGITTQVNNILANVEGLTAGTTADEIDRFMKSLNQATANLAATIEQSRSKLNDTLTNLEEISSETRRPLTSILTELDTTVKDVSNTVVEIDKATQDIQTFAGELNAIAADLRGGKGTLGKLMHEDTLYRSINRSLSELDATLNEFQTLARDLRENPERYFTVRIF